MLEDIDVHEEAELLGAGKYIVQVRKDLESNSDHNSLLWLSNAKYADAYLAIYLANKKNISITEVIDYANQHKKEWKDKINNYRYASLFTIAGKGDRIKKYYAGEKTILGLAGGNIRYLLQLLDNMMKLFFNKLEEGGTELELTSSLEIGAGIQTEVAYAVAKDQLQQIQNISDDGVQIARITFALGQCFQALLESKTSAPEQTKFYDYWTSERY